MRCFGLNYPLECEQCVHNSSNTLHTCHACCYELPTIVIVGGPRSTRILNLKITQLRYGNVCVGPNSIGIDSVFPGKCAHSEMQVDNGRRSTDDGRRTIGSDVPPVGSSGARNRPDLTLWTVPQIYDCVMWFLFCFNTHNLFVQCSRIWF